MEFEGLDRKLPFSLEAEQALLGSILIDPSCMDIVEGIVRADDFYVEENREIYAAMHDMYQASRNIDAVTLLRKLEENGTYDLAGGNQYLTQVAKTAPNAINAKDYAKIVYEKSVLRTLAEAGESIAEDAYSGSDDVDSILAGAEKRIYDISNKRANKGFVHIKDVLFSAYEELQQRASDPESLSGALTGFTSLDNMIVGIGKTDLVLIGARPGMGKTSFAMNIATDYAMKTRKKVCVFSLEMTAMELVNRMLSSEAKVDSKKMRAGNLDEDDWIRLAKTAEKLAETDILIDDSTNTTIASMLSKLRREKNIGMIIVDYLQMMQGDPNRKRDNRTVEVGDISRGLKLIAKEIEAPVLCCAQLNRGPEDRKDNRPALSDLRESGSMEQDADMVLLLYRSEYYQNKAEGENSIAEVLIAKNRHGSVGKIELGWDAKCTKFMNIDTSRE
ncbi:MAG: replicative DNA helicase [Clostridia bacterium]|nr:replicative DNA helicase [Clostridia bacterium]